MASETELDLETLLTRAVFLLHRVDNLDYPAIAWRLGISVEVVERRLARAMYRLGPIGQQSHLRVQLENGPARRALLA